MGTELRFLRALRDGVRRGIDRLLALPGRRLSLTRAGKVLLFITIAVGFAAYNTGNNLLFFGWGALLSSIVISGVLSEATLRAVQARLEMPDELRVGEASPLPIRLGNGSRRLPAFGVEICAELNAPTGKLATNGRYELRLAPKEERSVLSSFVPAHRGVHHLERFVAKTAYPFGFFEKSRGIWPDDDIELVVYPARVDVRDLGRSLVARLGDAPSRRPGLGDEFFSLRPYRDGDDLRRVLWRRAARTGRLVLRENEAAHSRELLLDVCLPIARVEDDADPARVADREAAVEEALAIAASLAEDLLVEQHAVGVRAPGVFIEPARGPRQRAAILTALGVLDEHEPPKDGSVSRRVARLAIVARGARAPASADATIDVASRAPSGAGAAA